MDVKKKRAVIFIDGNNFYHGMRAIGLPSGTEFDYARFSRKLVGNREWAGTRYYIGQIRQEGDLTRYQAQRKFLAYLGKFERTKIYLGRVESRPAKGVNKKLTRWLKALPYRNDIELSPQVVDELSTIAEAESKPLWIEKAVDVMIASDMVGMAHEGKYDVAYLISADGDFTPAVEQVRDTGRKVFVASPIKSNTLAMAADTFIPMNRGFFHGCWR